MNSRALIFLTITFFNISSLAAIIEFDPGAVNDSFFYRKYDMQGALSGTQLNGQSFELDFVFSDNKIAVAKNVEIDLQIFQDNVLGYWPADYFTIHGYLTNADGTPVHEPVYFENASTNPAQIWPNTGYYLPDGEEYLPAATGYFYFFEGDIINYSSDLISFSGIHFDLTAPDVAPSEINGLSFTMSHYRDYDEASDTWRNPIHISLQKAQPQVVPEPSAMLFFCFGLLVIAGFRKRVFRKKLFF